MLERRPTSLRFLFLGFAALSLLASSCNEDPSTQVVVLMDTDYLVPTDVDRIQARVLKVSEDGVGETETWSQVFLLSSGEEPGPGLYSLPASFGVVPAEGVMDRGIVIEVEALPSGSDEPLVKRRVRTGFIEGKFLVVRMLLYRACTDMICAEGESCGCEDAAACLPPFCVDEFVDPKNLEVIDNPAVLPPNPGIPIDPDVSECDPLTLCGTECVDTDSDPLFCGSCTTPCSSGEVCVDGACIEPGDCGTNGIDCSGFTYCDEVTGTCLRGCEANEQCGSSETCDTDIHDCVCMEGFDRCLDRCVDTQTDPLFCGDCATFCGSGEVCQAGMCADLGDCRTNGIGCSGLTYCDPSTGDCLPGCVQDDQCGAANEVCDTDINDCVCDTGFERCPPIAGACVDTQTDPLFCGDCQTACGTGEVCQFGACFDPNDCRTNGIGCSGFTYCDPSTGVCTSGCDNNVQCTVANEICNVTSHACVCRSGFERCPPFFGLCVDTQTDVRYCGNCQTACGTGEVCQLGACFNPNDCRTNGIDCSVFGFYYCDPSTGVCTSGCDNNVQCTVANEICNVTSHACVCRSGFERCPPFFGLCVDTQTDVRYCGNCQTTCGTGEVCQLGACFNPNDCRTNGIGCSGLTYCDPSTGECVRCVQDDQCGAANEVCDTDINECVCDTGFERCPPIAGACVDTQTDPLFCGDCATTCGTGEVCQAGACFDPNDCRTNGIGCSGLTYCDPSTGECVRCVQDDQCGAANEVCDTDINECVCDTGFERCPPIFGLCVDTQTDLANCGACDNACGIGQVCQSGACSPPVPD